MPPYAICRNNCGYVFDMMEERPGPTDVAPARCLRCRRKMIRWCPRCQSPLTDVSAKRPICSHCGGDVLKLAESGLMHAPLTKADPQKSGGALKRCG